MGMQNMNNTTSGDIKARIFISCGQREGEESELANTIANKLTQRGFDPYIAVEEQVLRGFTQNILPRLEESEYYLFIDFRRETVLDEHGNHLGNRGSLFSHQELAIAAFLNKPVIAFREQGVMGRDGVAGFFQINSIIFEDRLQLPDLVESIVIERGWDSSSRDELILCRIDDESQQVPYGNNRTPARFYHIQVRNLNRRNTARNCTAYIQSITNLHNGHQYSPEPVEIKWKGVKSQSSQIPPGFTREIDGIVVFPQSNQVYIGINTFLTDYGGYLDQYRLDTGRYLLEVMVFSDNFRPTRRPFVVSIGDNMRIIKLQSE
jgi:hypothetical protein